MTRLNFVELAIECFCFCSVIALVGESNNEN